MIRCSWRGHEWLLCPWDSPGKNTGVGCHSLLQGIVGISRDPGIEPWSLHCRQSLPSEPPGKPPQKHQLFVSRCSWRRREYYQGYSQWLYLRVSSFLFTVLSGEMTSLLLNPYSWRGCLPPSEWSESHSVVSDSFLQARILEWVAFPFSRGSPRPRNQTGVSGIAGGFFINWAIRELK